MKAVRDIFSHLLGVALKNTLSDQIDLKTLEDQSTFVLKDGSLATCLWLKGSTSQLGGEELSQVARKIRVSLAPYLSQVGYGIEVNFLRETETVKGTLDLQSRETNAVARSKRMDIDDVLAGRSALLSKVLVNEMCVITLYTRKNTLSFEEAKVDSAKVAKDLRDLPPMGGAQVSGSVMETQVSNHQGWVEAVVGVLNQDAKQVARVLSAEEALQEIRAALYPVTGSMKGEWKPLLPQWVQENAPAEKRQILPMPETELEMNGSAMGFLGVPSFSHQLATEDAVFENQRTVVIGETAFQSFDMTMAPEVLRSFNDLVQDVTAKDRTVPWRISFRIESGGIQAMRLDTLLLATFKFTSPEHNGRLDEVIGALREVDGEHDTVVRLRCSFTTWANNKDRLRHNAQIIQGAVRRWGNAQVDANSGNPLATTVSCLPGLTTKSTAPAASAPLSHALAMLPLSRQASPWEYGSLLFRTQSGKIWPYQQGSALQTTWNTICSGTPGMGKSVFLNATMFSSVLSGAGNSSELPMMCAIDHGKSLTGAASLIRESLPVSERHKVVCQTFSNSPDHAVNIFDPQLGMRMPMPAQLFFIRNMVKLLASENEQQVTGDLAGLIDATINLTYQDLMDNQNPKLYRPGDAIEVDEFLEAAKYPVTGHTAWYQIVDFLAHNRRLDLAEMAQRYAAPVLSDLVRYSSDERVASAYKGAKASNGRDLISHFHTRIQEVIREYPILSGVTRTSIGSARIIVFEMSEVAGKGMSKAEQKRTAIFYMMARNLGARNFFVTPDDVEMMIKAKAVPELYHAYHMERAKRTKETPKLILMDEIHRCGKVEAVMHQAAQDFREGRKYYLQILMASQLLEDFPPDLMKMATSIIICDIGSKDSLSTLRSVVDLSASDVDTLTNKLKGPTSEGSSFWAYIRTKGQRNPVRQHLLMTLSPVELWAYLTSPRDMALRSKLYAALGPVRARAMLAMQYPKGSAESDFDVRVKDRQSRMASGEDFEKDVISEVADEIIDLAYRLNGKGM